MPPNLPDSMPWQIYQAYLRGPSALLRVFEDALGKLALYGPPDPDMQERTIEALSDHTGRLQAQVERLQAELRELHYRNFQLQRRNQELEALSAKDSHNSSRPPSTDPVWAKRTKSLRRPSGKRPGGQAGHKGETLRLSDSPDRTVEYRPRECRGCHAALDSAQIVSHRRQQVVEVVPARLKVTEHRLLALRCGMCGKTTQGEFEGTVGSGVRYGPGVKARVLYLQQYQLLPYQRTAEAMRDLFGCRLSAGTVANIVRECSDTLVETELKIKRGLRRSSVLHADETGLRVEKKGQYIHVASNDRLTHYAFDSRRGRAAMDEVGIIPSYRGTLVRDGWWSYDYYNKCRHALCGAHLLRELTFFAELNDEQKAWADPLKELLLEMKAEIERAREAGEQRVGAEDQGVLLHRYDELVRKGLAANPAEAGIAAETASTLVAEANEGAGCQKQARNLLLRLQRKREEVLRFMTDFHVPFDNNQAERDLRMVKLQQKIGGCFRTETGARSFCRIRGYISTMRKQGKEVLVAFERACRGKPLSLRKRAG